MIENENTAIVRRWFEELWNQGRLETIDELLAPDAVAYDMTGPGGDIRGREGFRAAAKVFLTAFGETHFTVEDIFGVEDRVAVRLSLRIKHTGPLGELPPTGNEVTVPVTVHDRTARREARHRMEQLGRSVRPPRSERAAGTNDHPTLTIQGSGDLPLHLQPGIPGGHNRTRCGSSSRRRRSASLWLAG